MSPLAATLALLLAAPSVFYQESTGHERCAWRLWSREGTRTLRELPFACPNKVARGPGGRFVAVAGRGQLWAFGLEGEAQRLDLAGALKAGETIWGVDLGPGGKPRVLITQADREASRLLEWDGSRWRKLAEAQAGNEGSPVPSDGKGQGVDLVYRSRLGLADLSPDLPGAPQRDWLEPGSPASRKVEGCKPPDREHSANARALRVGAGALAWCQVCLSADPGGCVIQGRAVLVGPTGQAQALPSQPHDALGDLVLVAGKPWAVLDAATGRPLATLPGGATLVHFWEPDSPAPPP